MCERKPTYKKGKIVDQWKVDRSRDLWKRMTARNWNQPDKVRALMTFIKEGDFDEKAHGDKDVGGAYGMCQFHIPSQRQWLVEIGKIKGWKLLPSFFDIKWQMEACIDKYAGGTKFYGYRDENRPAVKKAKAKELLGKITCS